MTAPARPSGPEGTAPDEATPSSPPEQQGPRSGGPASTGSRRVVALDGLRGLSLLIIVLYHVRLGPFTGGLSAVTVFFTLSGYLIMSRTLLEVDRTGTFGFGSFVERRVRRLVPASLVCLLGTLIATHLVGDAVQRAKIGGDTLAALVHVANWRFLF
jgi:peptidoglycan/LPS O-acetylase OafA/YrhL